jgi:dolichyl-phosphate-mannose--protein O-mannosyl transferase
MRMTAAFFGALTPPVLYRVIRKWGGGVSAALLAASFMLFDNLNLTEARLVLIDSQLIFWCTVSLAVAQEWWGRLNEQEDASEVLRATLGLDIDEVGAELVKKEAARGA